MAFQFKGFRATRPVARIVDQTKKTYEAFFIVYGQSNKKIPMRFSKGINVRPPTDRAAQARATADVLWEALNKGWNPLVDKYPKFEKEVREQTAYNLGLALDFAIEKKSMFLSKYSMYDYKACVRFIKTAARATGHDSALIASIRKRDIREIITEAKEINDWSNKARNKYLTILKSLLSVLEEEELIDFNPAHKIKNEREEETIGYRRVTDSEKEAIAEHLLNHAPDFFEYLMMIYDDGIRRTESLQLRVQDVNLVREEIRIRAEVAKTNTERIVPITDTIKQVLLRRQIWDYAPTDFLFSADKFKPGPLPYHPNTPTSWWRELVIKGLGIDCKMYSLKHKGADDKIEAGMELDILRTLYGHKSKQMTEVYARAVRDKYKNQIIEKSPLFAKVVRMNRKAK